MTNNETLDINDLKKFARANRSIAETVLLAQAFAELERERVDAYVRPIFDSYTFVSDAGHPITDPDHLYMTDLEGANYLAYNNAVLDANVANGWTGDRDFCPALTAETLLIDAQNCLLQVFAEHIGASYNSFYGETRTKALKLLLGVCLTKTNAGTLAESVSW